MCVESNHNCLQLCMCHSQCWSIRLSQRGQKQRMEFDIWKLQCCHASQTRRKLEPQNIASRLGKVKDRGQKIIKICLRWMMCAVVIYILNPKPFRLVSWYNLLINMERNFKETFISITFLPKFSCAMLISVDSSLSKINQDTTWTKSVTNDGSKHFIIAEFPNKMNSSITRISKVCWTTRKIKCLRWTILYF